MPNATPLYIFLFIVVLCVLVVVGLALSGFFMTSTGHCPKCEHALNEDEYKDGFCNHCHCSFEQSAVDWE